MHFLNKQEKTQQLKFAQEMEKESGEWRVEKVHQPLGLSLLLPITSFKIMCCINANNFKILANYRINFSMDFQQIIQFLLDFG